MLGNNIDDTLTDLDYSGLYKMAEWHDKQATILRARAQTLQEYEYMQDKVTLRVEFLRNTPKIVMRYLKQGHSAERACELAAQHTGVELKTIATHWKRFIDDKERKSVRLRNSLILELHGLGLTNVNIAERLNMHPGSVSRILKAEKCKRIYNPNPERIALFSQKQNDNQSLHHIKNRA